MPAAAEAAEAASADGEAPLATADAADAAAEPNGAAAMDAAPADGAADAGKPYEEQARALLAHALELRTMVIV